MKPSRLLLAGLIVLGFAVGAQAQQDDLEQAVQDLQDQVMQLEFDLQEFRDSTSNMLSQVVDRTSVGGDIKFYLFDMSDGKKNRQSRTRSHPSAGLSGIILYFQNNLTDTVSVDIQPQISASASATPRLDAEDKIRRSRGAGRDPYSVSMLRAHLTWLLPHDFQLKVGAIKPLFTWDYGYELFWHEEFHGNFATTNPWLGSWGTDAGVEVYRNFEFEGWSLPAYVYVLNGLAQEVVDNNRGYSVLGHVQPEFLDGRFKLLGSLGHGSWDDKNRHSFTRYAFGAMAHIQDVELRGEFMGSRFARRIGTRDVNPWGLYTKVLWSFHPQFRAVGGYAHVHHDFHGFYRAEAKGRDTYDQFTAGLNYFLTDSTTVMLQYGLTNARRRSTDIRMSNVHRATLGFRTTF